MHSIKILLLMIMVVFSFKIDVFLGNELYSGEYTPLKYFIRVLALVLYFRSNHVELYCWEPQ